MWCGLPWWLSCKRICLPMPPVYEMWVRFLGQDDSLEKARQPIPVFLPGESHGFKPRHESATGIHISPPFEPPSHLSTIPPLQDDTELLFEFPEPHSKFPLAIYFTYGKFPCYSFHTSHPLLPSPHVCKSILYIYFSIAAL